MKNLQGTLTKYLKEKTLEEITIESIKSTFKNLKDDDSDLYLTHALVNQQYEISKVLKMLEILFQNGLNPNKKGYAEYTFLHIALYGADTKDKKTIPYPLSFFEQVIPLAKKYGFDVNSKDEDGDTLIHTAIYSEDYFDSIEPLIRLLGKDFDLTAKNNSKKTIIDALNESIKEATLIKNDKWYLQLYIEKELLSSIIEASSNPVFSIPEYMSGTVDISSYLDPTYIKKEIETKISNLQSEFEKNELEQLTMESTANQCNSLKESIKNSALTEEEKEEFLSRINEYGQQITEQLRMKIGESISKLTIDSKIEECENLQNVIHKSYLPIEIIEELEKGIISLISKINQQLFLKQLKLDIENICTIKDIENCLTKASEIIDPTIKQEMIGGLNKRHQEVKNRLDQIKAKFLITKNLLILDQDNFGSPRYQNEKREVFKNVDLTEMEEETLDSFVSIQSFDEFEESLDALTEEITVRIKTIMSETIHSELEKAKIVDQSVGTSLFKELVNEIIEMEKESQTTEGAIPKQKKKKA